MTSKSRSTTTKIAAKLPPVHPGKILRETLGDLGMSVRQLAQSLHVPANRISAIVARDGAITSETAMRLGQRFSTTPEYWLNMQTQFDLESE